MASIWLQVGSKAPEKIAGNMPHEVALSRFKTQVEKTKRANADAKLSYSDEMVALFQWPNGSRFQLYVEPYSPPSAPEKGQPKIRHGKGLLVDGAGDIHDLPVPSGPEATP
jgi:hypothetical protein